MILMENMQEKKMQPRQPMQNIRMMRAEPHEEDHSINIVTRSGMTIGVDKGKQPETDGWVCKAAEKEIDFDLNHVKETLMEEKKNFVGISTLGTQEKMLETSAT